MNAHEPIYDVNEWRRLGRGKDLQFFATDDEVQDWLIKALPKKYAPYTLIGVESVKAGKIYIREPFELDVTELKRAMHWGNKVRWQFWIRSKIITPELNFSKQMRITWVFSYTGLVELQHGSNIRHYGLNTKELYRDASSIGVVDKVINDATGDIKHHKEYLRIFNSLKRQIKKRLCYSSIHTFKNGSQREDRKLQLMTEDAVQAYHSGLLLKNAPGQKIK